VTWTTSGVARHASNLTTRKAKDGALDLAQLHNGWADRLARTLGVPLASVAPSVWHAAGGHTDAPGQALSQLDLSRAAQNALAQRKAKSTWARADLIKYLGWVLPRSGRDPAAAAASGGSCGPRVALGVRAGAVPGSA
jgi:hypothetical protein